MNRWFLCKDGEEFMDHLLYCTKKGILLQLVLFVWVMQSSIKGTLLRWHGSFGVVWVLQSLVKATLLSWQGRFIGKKRKKAWKIAPLCLYYTIWK